MEMDEGVKNTKRRGERMAIQIITKNNSIIGVFCWTDGFRPLLQHAFKLEDEARRNPVAVINRLMREQRWEEAERIMDSYLS
jgi:hypothetical protein